MMSQEPILLDALNERELEIITLLAEDLSNKEIADSLFLAPNTVKWYVRQLNSKLDTTNREEIVQRAHELGLLEAQVTESAIRPRQNLPHQTTPFIGRDAELDELHNIIEKPDVRLLTILAPGGMGKTRLALEATEQQINNYSDGVYFVPLQALSNSEQIVSTIASNSFYAFQADERSQKQQILDFLSNKQILLLMDNWEHLLDGVSLINEILEAAPEVKILATSREKLNLLGETVYVLHGMAFPIWETPEDALEYDAVQLLVQSAQRVRADWQVKEDNLDFVARVCRLTQGMPLGILLATSWLDMLSLERICDEIQKNVDFLETEMRDVPERQQSIRAIFKATWERLSQQEQDVFMKMSVFRSGFLIDAAEDLTGVNLSIFQKLINKALLQINKVGRYDLHELLRQYAEEKLEDSGKSAIVRNAHSHYYLEMLSRLEDELKSSGNIQASNVINGDIENIYVAWSYAIEQKRMEDIEQSLESLFAYYTTPARAKEGLEIFSKAVLVLDMDNPQGQQGLLLGKLLARQVALTPFVAHPALPAEMLDLIVSEERSLAILRKLGTDEDLYPALYGLAYLNRKSNQKKTETYFQEAVSIIRKVNDMWWLTLCLNRYGINMFDFTKYKEADILLQEAYEEAQKLGVPFLTAEASFLFGIVLRRSGKYEEGFHLSQEALALYRKINDLSGVSAMLNILGWAAYSHGDYEEAYEYLTECVELIEAHELEYRRWHAYHSMAAVLHALGRLDEARDYYYRCIEEALNVWNFRSAMGNSIGIAALFVNEGKFEFALELLAMTLEHEYDPAIISQGEAALERIKTELDADTFQAVWERGKTLDLETVLREHLEEFRNRK